MTGNSNNCGKHTKLNIVYRLSLSIPHPHHPLPTTPHPPHPLPTIPHPPPPPPSSPPHLMQLHPMWPVVKWVTLPRMLPHKQKSCHEGREDANKRLGCLQLLHPEQPWLERPQIAQAMLTICYGLADLSARGTTQMCQKWKVHSGPQALLCMDHFMLCPISTQTLYHIWSYQY